MLYRIIQSARSVSGRASSAPPRRRFHWCAHPFLCYRSRDLRDGADPDGHPQKGPEPQELGQHFSSKVKCGDCGSWYGPKVWHSNDAYRKVIWQCNHKFDGQKCATPTLNEDQIKALFLKAANTVIGAKERFIAIFERTLAPAFLARMPKELPLLFLSGDADPVGEQGKGVRRAIQSLKDAGVQNIESIFYPGARHELLVETNKLEVFADIAAWLDKQLAKQ